MFPFGTGWAVTEDDGVPTASEVHDPTGEEYRTVYDSSANSVSRAVIDAVARATGAGPVDMALPGWPVDPDVLDALFVPTVSGPPQGDANITFEYASCEVTVHSYGVIAVRPDAGRGAGRGAADGSE